MEKLITISREDFAHVVRFTPLVAIDLILTDPEGAVLVGLRNNAPAKGWWFVPGGRIAKNERLAEAFERILEGETGLKAKITDARLIGAYDHLYPDNRFEEPGYGTHYVTLGYQLRLADRPALRMDDQHSQCRWVAPDELLVDRQVHENTKAYLR